MSLNESNKHIQNLISDWDAMIRQGQLGEAANGIRKINVQQIPRQSLQTFASVCRRAGLTEQGLRALHSVVRPQGPQIKEATAEETCEYGALLMRNGSLTEAMNLFVGIDSKRLPLSLLYQGFCHVYNWDYEAAAPLFEAVVHSEIDDYSKLIALVNWGATLSVIGRTQEALVVIDRAMDLAEQSKASRLVGNCLEIRSQIYVNKNDYASAKKDLHKAKTLFDKNKNYDVLMIAKYFAVIQAAEEKSLAPLKEFKTEAQSKKHWESVRDADFFSVKLQFNQSLFDHLIFGSPMPGYRRRVLRELPHEPNGYYLFGKKGSARVLDLESGHSQEKIELNPGKKIHAVLATLVADFYAPRDSGTLFSILYPNEYFDAGTSANRVRQAIYRARCWLREKNIPAEIYQEDGKYRLAIEGDFGIRVPYIKSDLQGDAARLLEMKRALPAGKTFTVAEACALLNISRSTFHRLAELGLRTNQLRRTGVKRSTAYIFHD